MSSTYSQQPACNRLVETDSDLVQLFLEGNRESLGVLVERYQRALYFLCLRIVQNHDDALELVQKTFLQVLEKLHTLQKTDKFKTWIYRIAINLCYNLLREKSLYLRVLSDLPVCTESTRDDPLAREEEELLVRNALSQLSPKQRISIILHIYHNLSYQEIGEILGCQEATVRSHFHLGIKKISNQLRKKIGSQHAM